MKQTILYLLLGIFLLASCQQEELPNAETGYGTLSLNGISVQVANETVSSRAVDADLYVDILQSDTIYKTYAPGQVPDKIELPVGDYQLQIYNEAYKSKDTYEGKGQAIYFKENIPVTIQAEQVTRLDSIEVPMINFGVSFSFPEEYKETFPTCNLTVIVGERTVGNIQPGETAYFPYDAEVTTFSYTLSVTNTDEETQTAKGTYGDAGDETISAGTNYTVTYEMQTQSLSVAQ